MSFRVQARRCPTCIFRRDSPLDLKRLLDAVRDPNVSWFFKGYRVCHHSDNACCRGFWDRYKDSFTLGQLAQRLGVVEFVEDDRRK